MPDIGCGEGDQWEDQFDLAQTRQNPEHDTEGSGNGETVKDRIIGCGLDVTVGQQGAIREKSGSMKLYGSDHRKHKPDDEPQGGAAKESE
jgi:hypothetical protein